MASQNNTAYSNFNAVGLFGGGQSSAGYGNDASGLGQPMADAAFQVPFTAVGSTGVYTVNAAYAPYLVNTVTTAGNQVGTIVTLGYASPVSPYTVTSASPAVFTSADLYQTDSFNDLVGATTDISLIANGTPVVLYGATLGGFTASVPWGGFGGAYSPASQMTVYYMVNISTNTFQLSATLGGAAINSTGTAITAYSGQSLVQVVGNGWGSGPGVSVQTPYYMVGVSGSTFQLASTAGGSAITGSGTYAGILQFDLENQQVSATMGSNQVPYGAGGGTQNGVQVNGFRYGAQSAQNVPYLSLDENPQLMWQNVPGSTCQNGQLDSIVVGGTNYANNSGTQFIKGWGAAGGFISGQTVYETKAPKLYEDDHGTPETYDHRELRLNTELTGLKEKQERTAAENKRMDVVESALAEMKEDK